MAPDIKKTPNNAEIEQALKEFEAKSSEQPAGASSPASAAPIKKEVEGVQFETDSYKAIKFYNETSTPKMVQMVMKYSGGSIKEQKHAEYVLFVGVILIVIVSLWLFFSGGNIVPRPVIPIPPELIRREQMNKLP
jgi:hypothetical protein